MAKANPYWAALEERSQQVKAAIFLLSTQHLTSLHPKSCVQFWYPQYKALTFRSKSSALPRLGVGTCHRRRDQKNAGWKGDFSEVNSGGMRSERHKLQEEPDLRRTLWLVVVWVAWFGFFMLRGCLNAGTAAQSSSGISMLGDTKNWAGKGLSN